MAANQRAWVRELAHRVAEVAAGPENERIKQRWRDVNARRRPDRPAVWCRPVGAWDELLPKGDLVCTDERLRAVERAFRQTLIKHDIGDDTPVEGWFPVHAVFDCDPPNTWGLAIGRHQPGEADGAWAFDPPLRTAADYDRLRLPSFSYNHGATEERLARSHDLLGDILPVRRVCEAPLTASLGTPAAELRGLMPMMLDAATEPGLLHQLMAHLRNGVLQAMRQVEESGLLTPNNSGPMIASDPLGEPGPDGCYSYRHLWCMANSQEFDQVSPRMWREFCLEYQRPILERFGAVAYGCCEDLTHKMDDVLALPNLRIFVCSAWTNLDQAVERIGDRLVIMWRLKASDVVFAPDEESLRRQLDEGLNKLRGCHVQIVLRELQTLSGHTDRLHVWTRLAIEAASRLA